METDESANNTRIYAAEPVEFMSPTRLSKDGKDSKDGKVGQHKEVKIGYGLKLGAEDEVEIEDEDFLSANGGDEEKKLDKVS